MVYKYRNNSTGELVNEAQLRASFTNIAFPDHLKLEHLDVLGYSPVLDGKSHISLNYNQVLKEDGVMQQPNGTWVMQWKVETLPSDESTKLATEWYDTQLNNFHSIVQDRLDTFARTRGYDNIISACSYVNSTNPKWASEGRYAIVARDLTWQAVFEFEADVRAGKKVAPGGDSRSVPDWPELEWPISPTK